MSRLELLVSKLQSFYGLLPSPPRDPFALFVWEVLSHHTTPGRRDAAYARLKRIPALTPDAMWRAPQKKLEEAVSLAGPYVEQRLRALRTGVALFRRIPGLSSAIKGPMRTARRALKPLPQPDEGGARRMLLFAADHPGMPVDTRVARVARRLGYGTSSADLRQSARSVERALRRQQPSTVEGCRRALLYLSHHGAVTCTERDPHCQVCPLLPDCPEGLKRTG